MQSRIGSQSDAEVAARRALAETPGLTKAQRRAVTDPTTSLREAELLIKVLKTHADAVADQKRGVNAR